MRKTPSPEKLRKLDELFSEAKKETELKKQEKLVRTAKDFAKHNNLVIPTEWKNQFCKKCNHFFKEKKKIRLSNKKISIECLSCHKVSRKQFKTKTS
jgi:RNase P subunit RPR2